VTEVKVEKEFEDRRVKLFTLWIFATLNFVYADVVTLFDKTFPRPTSVKRHCLEPRFWSRPQSPWFSCLGF
jgi:hypothetical protein